MALLFTVFGITQHSGDARQERGFPRPGWAEEQYLLPRRDAEVDLSDCQVFSSGVPPREVGEDHFPTVDGVGPTPSDVGPTACGAVQRLFLRHG